MKKKSFTVLLLLLAVLLSVQPLSAQTPAPADDVIYRTVQQMPQFPGGMEALQKYFRENVRYPQSAIDSNIQGHVMVEFVIAQTGDITRVSVIKSVNPALDSEAVRVVNAMPEWEPGVQEGQKVNVYYRVPITFKLEDDTAVSKDTLQNVIPDEMPQYPGGMDALKQYLKDNVQYPDAAIKEHIQGSVLIGFVVTENGNVSNVEVLKGLSPEINYEAIRVIRTMPKWIPGTKDGKNISLKYKVPITFRVPVDVNNR